MRILFRLFILVLLVSQASAQDAVQLEWDSTTLTPSYTEYRIVRKTANYNFQIFQ